MGGHDTSKQNTDFISWNLAEWASQAHLRGSESLRRSGAQNCISTTHSAAPSAAPASTTSRCSSTTPGRWGVPTRAPSSVPASGPIRSPPPCSTPYASGRWTTTTSTGRPTQRIHRTSFPAALSICQMNGLSGQATSFSARASDTRSKCASPSSVIRAFENTAGTTPPSPASPRQSSPVECLDFTADQIQQAIGISASPSMCLGAVTAGKLTNMKNTVDPMATRCGVEAATARRPRLQRTLNTSSTARKAWSTASRSSAGPSTSTCSPTISRKCPKLPLEDSRLRHEVLPDRSPQPCAADGNDEDRQGT